MHKHLGTVMNLARIKLLAFVLQALCVVQTVSLHKIASAMPTSVERDSNLRRVQRFLAGYALNLILNRCLRYSLHRLREISLPRRFLYQCFGGYLIYFYTCWAMR